MRLDGFGLLVNNMSNIFLKSKENVVFLYIKKHPNIRAYSIYRNAVGFHNEYMDFFCTDAFDNRREYITSFYGNKRDNLERKYTYLNEKEMNQFVDESSVKIYQILKEKYL